MSQPIYTIPVHEVFEPKDGCPICRMRDIMEERCVEYILGAAMMEPDIRMETNKLGFCKRHFDNMLERKNRLSLALLLESHLAQINRTVFSIGGDTHFKADTKDRSKKAEKVVESCYVCTKVDSVMENMMDSIFHMYHQSSDFRALFAQQEMLCLPHYQMLCDAARTKLSKREMAEFLSLANRLAGAYCHTLENDVRHFTKMFDYRNSGPEADWGNSKDSIERAIWFLTSRKAEE